MELGLNAEKSLQSDGCNVAAKCLDISKTESIKTFVSQVIDVMNFFVSLGSRFTNFAARSRQSTAQSIFW